MAEAEKKHLLVMYIKSSVEKVWDALINAELTRKYYFDAVVESDWKVGSPIVYTAPNKDGEMERAVYGEITAFEPKRKLSHTFNFHSVDEPPSHVSFELEEHGELVKLTLLHDSFPSEESAVYNSVIKGWPFIISGLKSYLETGERLPAPSFE